MIDPGHRADNCIHFTGLLCGWDVSACVKLFERCPAMPCAADVFSAAPAADLVTLQGLAGMGAGGSSRRHQKQLPSSPCLPAQESHSPALTAGVEGSLRAHAFTEPFLCVGP